MDAVVTNAVQTLIEALVLALISVIVFYAKQGLSAGVNYLKSKLSADQYAHLKQYASTAIRSLEQSPVTKDFDGAKKKELALTDITQWANTNKIPVTYALLDKIVEEGVQIMNTEIGPILNGTMLSTVTGPIIDAAVQEVKG